MDNGRNREKTAVVPGVLALVAALISIGAKEGMYWYTRFYAKRLDSGALMADAVGTVVGACLGTSTVTSYVESSAGVSVGGRTGLTSVITGLPSGFQLAVQLSGILSIVKNTVSLLHEMNTSFPIADTVSGITTAVRLKQDAKAPFFIDVTPS